MKNVYTFILSKLKDTDNLYIPRGKSLEDCSKMMTYGYRNSGWNATTAGKFAKQFDFRVQNRTYYSWFLEHYGYKYCCECEQVLLLDYFSNNKTKSTGKNSWCRNCTSSKQKDNPEAWRAYRAKRRASELQRTPDWSEIDKIKEFYNNCPKGMQVDHIIPLQGANVSGLHVLENLQYLSPEENRIKNNNFKVP